MSASVEDVPCMMPISHMETSSSSVADGKAMDIQNRD